jgi:hypothetical protein
VLLGQQGLRVVRLLVLVEGRLLAGAGQDLVTIREPKRAASRHGLGAGRTAAGAAATAAALPPAPRNGGAVRLHRRRGGKVASADRNVSGTGRGRRIAARRLVRAPRRRAEVEGGGARHRWRKPRRRPARGATAAHIWRRAATAFATREGESLRVHGRREGREYGAEVHRERRPNSARVLAHERRRRRLTPRPGRAPLWHPHAGPIRLRCLDPFALVTARSAPPSSAVPRWGLTGYASWSVGPTPTVSRPDSGYGRPSCTLRSLGALTCSG